VARVAELDAAIESWTVERTVEQVLNALGDARVPAGKVYTVADIATDPHFRAREMILTQKTREGYEVEVPGIVPKLSGTPGTVRTAAPRLGEDTDAVLREMGLSDEQIAQLRRTGIVA
jgi:formyl-CoA transferase